VKKPGAYPIKGRLTVVELISLAEGFSKIASPNKVKVIRTLPDGTKKETVIRVRDIMNKHAGDKENLVLLSGDVVIVPESIF
jgi:polysaccharide export outer membrane protein